MSIDSKKWKTRINTYSVSEKEVAQRDRQIHGRTCQIEKERLKERHREGER